LSKSAVLYFSAEPKLADDLYPVPKPVQDIVVNGKDLGKPTGERVREDIRESYHDLHVP